MNSKRLTNNRLHFIWLTGLVLLMVMAAVSSVPAATEYEISGNDKDYSPAIAYNPDDNEYLVVWQYYWDPDYDIHARRVDAQGNPLGGVLGVSSNASADETKPRVAYNSYHNKYLVVFEFKSGSNSNIAGRLLNADGSTSGSTFAIASTTRDETAPDVVWNSSARDFFVVWAEDFGSIEFPQRNIYARRVWSDGSMDSEGVPYTIANSSYDEANPAVAHSPSSRQHLIVWEEYQYYGGSWDDDIRGRTVQDYGSPYYYSPPTIYADFNVSTRGNNQTKPRLAYNSEDASFLAVWEDHSNLSRWEIYGQRMNSIGTKILFNFAISSGTSPPNDRLNPDVSYDKPANAYLVVWEYEYSASDHDIKYRRVSNTGGLLDSETSLAASGSNEILPAVASDGAWHHLVVWEEWGSSAYNIYGEQVNASSDMPPWISPTIPNQTKNEDNPVWTLDLTGYENDDHDSGTSLDWSVSGVDTSLFSASVNITTDVVTFTPVSNAYGSDVITLTLTDSGGKTDTQNITVTLNAVNDYPWISPTIPDQTKSEDASPWSIDLTGYEHDVEHSGTNLDWSVSGVNTSLFSAVVTDSNNDIITFYPVSNAYGSDTITLTLRDSNGTGLTDTQNITVTLNPVNDDPYISPSIPNQTKNEDAKPWTIDLTGYEHDVEDSGTSLDWSVSGVDSSLCLVVVTDVDNDIIRFAPKPNAYGSDVITLTLTDSGGKTDTQDITVTLNAQNDWPWISPSIPNQQGLEDEPWTLNLTPYENDVEDSGTGLDWSVSDVNPDLFSASINTETDEITFTPETDASGEHVITLTLTDSGGKTDSQEITVTIDPQNDPPYIINVQGQPVPNQTEAEDSPAWNLDLTPWENDAEDSGTALDWSLSGVDTSLFSASLNTDTDVLTFTPVPNAHGSNEITLTLTDSGGLVANQNITVTLTPENDAPEFTSEPAATNAVEESIYTYNVTATDVDDDDILTITGTPAWLTLNDHGDGTATLEGTPDDADVGGHWVELTVMDSAVPALSDSQSFTITVSPVNDVPVITGQDPDPLVTDEETPLLITLEYLTVNDPDNTYPDDFSLTVLPGNNYDIDTEENSIITPGLDFHGTLNVPVTVSDGTDESEPFGLTVTVNNVDDTGIQGYVRDADTEQGIAYAVVFFAIEVEGEVVDGSALTDETGHYVLDTPEGSVGILVYAPGYELVEDFVDVVTGPDRTAFNAALVRVEDMVGIHGRIVDCEEGEEAPIIGARVESSSGEFTYTDESGAFHLDLLFGFYAITIHAEGYMEREEWLFVGDEPTDVGNLCLIPEEGSAAILLGAVLDRDTGLPVVDAFVNTPDYGFSWFTDFDGFYLLTVPAASGTVTVTAEATGYNPVSLAVPISPGEVIEQDIQLNPMTNQDDHCDQADPCATLLTINGEPVAGRIGQAGDEDWFQFQLVEAGEYEIETLELGAGADTFIELYREDGTTLVALDDDSGVDVGSLIVWTSDQSGLFYLKVRHFGSSGTGSYFVSVRGSDDYCNEQPETCAAEIQTNGDPLSGRIEVPGDVDWFTFTGTAGLVYEIETFDLGDDSDTFIELFLPDGTTPVASDDDGGSGFASSIVWEANQAGPFYVKVRHFLGTGTGFYSIHVSEYDDHCNGMGPCATHVMPNQGPIPGTFETPYDEDWFQFEVVAGGGLLGSDLAYVIETSGLTEGCDTTLSLHTPSGEVVFDDDGGSEYLASRISRTFATGGTAYIVVRHWSPQDSTGSYNLEVSVDWASFLPGDGSIRDRIIEALSQTDIFFFPLESGRTYSIEMSKLEGLLTGHFIRARISLVGREGATLIDEHDVAEEDIPFAFEFSPTTSGIYFLKVKALELLGRGGYEISLQEADDHGNDYTEASTIGTNATAMHGRFESSGDVDWFKFPAVPGQRYVIETGDLDERCDTVMALYGEEVVGGIAAQSVGDDSGNGLILLAEDDDGGDEDFASRIEWVAPPSGLFSDVFYVSLRHFDPDGRGSYRVSVRALSGDDYADSPNNATPVYVSTGDMPVPPTSGRINSAGDVDWFTFEAELGQYIIETLNLDDQCDTVIHLYGPDTTLALAEDDDSGPGRGSRIVWSANGPGTYYVKVQHFSAQGRGTYELSVREVPVCQNIVPDDEPFVGNLTNDAAFSLFCVNVEARDEVEVILEGLSTDADFDLYLKMNSPPSPSEYDARSFSPGAQEAAGLTARTSGVLFIMVRSYEGLGDYSLQVMVSSGPRLTLEDGVPQDGTLEGPDDGALYSFEVAGGDQVMVTLDGPDSSADFDLYAKLGSPPTPEMYDARSITPFGDETLSLGPLTGGTLYVWVVSFSGSGEYTVTAEIVDEEACTPLSSGVAQAGSLSYPTDDDLYCIEVDEMEQLNVALNGPDAGADFDLYIGFGAPPTLSEYDWAVTESDADEDINNLLVPKGTVYIRAYSYYGHGGYEITASRIAASALSKLYSDPNKVLFVKGQVLDKLTSEPLQPSAFCIAVKDLGKFCYNSDPQVTSEISFIPGGHFFFVMDRLVGDYTLTLTDVPCYLDTLPQSYEEEGLSSVLFEVEVDPEGDCDGDVMENDWEKENTLNMWKDDASLDLDGDGYSNLQEYNGNSEPDDEDSIPEGSKFVKKGDVSGDDEVDLTDAIVGLQAVTGIDVSKVIRPNYRTSEVDVNEDGRLGLEEVIYVLQEVSNSR